MNQIVDEIACALLPIIQGEYFAFFGHRYLTSVFNFFNFVVFKPLFWKTFGGLFSTTDPWLRLSSVSYGMCAFVLVWFWYFITAWKNDSVWLELFSNETVRLKEVLAGTEKMESPSAEVNETSPSGVCKS